MNAHTLAAEEVLKALESNDSVGLTSEESQKRLEKYGRNELAEGKKKTLLQRFIAQFEDILILILLISAAVSFVIAIYNPEEGGFFEPILILVIVIINACVGVYQESKAEASLEALKKMSKPHVRVIRNGEEQIIDTAALVPGDLIRLEAGDYVPADCRLVRSVNLKVEEAVLTGEALPSEKDYKAVFAEDTPLGDRINLIYSGCSVVYGTALAVVTATGMNTEMGKIASLLDQAEEVETPLQIKLAQLGKILGYICLGACLVVFVEGLISGQNFLKVFMVAVSLAVAAIPEGLPAIVTIVLSMGVQRLAEHNAIVRSLPAVETLGSANVICSDKTGTLTQNRMTVVDTYTEDPMLLAKAMACCSDSKRGLGMHEAVGEPTENALVNHAHDLRLYKDELDEVCPRIGEAPFDSMRKMMSTVHQEEDGIRQYTKGACEVLLRRCSGYIQDGAVKPMTEEYRQFVMHRNKEFADRALRVLGAAYRIWQEAPSSYEAEDLEQDLIFIGFVGMIDPCRPEVYDAIKECRSAGIRPVMITGDHRDTAVAIARDLGIITDESEAIEGAKLEDISDEELVEEVTRYSVYARVQPEHKTRIVRAWQARGMVVAMTGDGVNDAPSIKAADIGVGMGITGTDVTKGVSDMVLADDNFATIVNAVEEGRKIYDNVHKVVQFQLLTNLCEIVTVFVASMLGFKIFSAAHLLWINMVTDSAPGLALGMERAEEGLMKRKPRPADESLFSNGSGAVMLVQGIIMGVLIFFSFLFGEWLENGRWALTASTDGTTMAFLTCNFSQMFSAFNNRSLTGSIFKMKHQNWWLWGALLWTIVLTCGVLFIPALCRLFGLASISFKEFMIAIGFALINIPVSEVAKLIRKKGKNHADA